MLVGDRSIHLSTATDPLHPVFMSKQGNTGNFLFHSFAVDPLDPSKIFGVAQDQLSGLLYTGDTTWNYATAGTEVGRFLVSPVDDHFVYNLSFTEKKGFDVQRSVDGGQTWTSQTSGLILDDFGGSDSQTLFNAFALNPSNPRHIVLGGTQVFQTTDMTTNPSQPVDLAWSQVGTLPDNVGNVTAIAVAPGTAGQTMYAATSTGQFPSNHKLFVATMGRGVWKLRVLTTLETGDVRTHTAQTRSLLHRTRL